MVWIHIATDTEERSKVALDGDVDGARDASQPRHAWSSCCLSSLSGRWADFARAIRHHREAVSQQSHLSTSRMLMNSRLYDSGLNSGQKTCQAQPGASQEEQDHVNNHYGLFTDVSGHTPVCGGGDWSTYKTSQLVCKSHIRCKMHSQQAESQPCAGRTRLSDLVSAAKGAFNRRRLAG